MPNVQWKSIKYFYWEFIFVFFFSLNFPAFSLSFALLRTRRFLNNFKYCVSQNLPLQLKTFTMAHSSKNLISYVMSHFTTPSLSYIALINYTHFSPHQISSFFSVCVCVYVHELYQWIWTLYRNVNQNVSYVYVLRRRALNTFSFRNFFSLFSCSFHVALQTHATTNIYTHTYFVTLIGHILNIQFSPE